MYSSSICLARSISAASPSRQIDILGRGILGNLFSQCNEASIVKHKSMSYMLGIQSWYVLDGARETLVSLGVVVFETDLELNGLDKLPLLFLGLGQELLDRRPHACH